MDDKEKVLRWNLQESLKELNLPMMDGLVASAKIGINKQRSDQVNFSKKKLNDYLKELLKKRKPQMLADSIIDLSKLKTSCQGYIDYVDSEEYSEDNDEAHYMFETAIETFFGKKVWEFVNNRHR